MREMKDSSVEWVDRIPKTWAIVPLKTQVSFAKGLPITKENLEETGIAVVSYGQIHSKINAGSYLKEELVRYVSEDYLNSNPDCLAEKGDIFVADTSEDYEGIGNAVLIDWDRKVFAGYHTVIIRPSNRRYSKYLSYLFMTDAWRSQLRSRASGIKVFSVTQGILRKTTIIVPSEESVQRITEYLDSKCSKIDSIIAKQERIIEGLKNYKVSLVTEVVTKGLNPNAELKPSGVSWLGNIPQNWNVNRVSNLYVQTSESGRDDLPILTVSINSGISDRELEDDEKDRVFVRSEDKTKYKRVIPGDLAYNMMRAWQGAFGAARVEGMVSPAYITCRPKKDVEIDTRYIEYLFRTPLAIEEMHRYSHGVADFRLRLYWPEFKNIRLCLPCIKEQKEIADFLDVKVREIDNVVERKRTYIEKLIDYKKSLIYEVVTGKKEV